MIMLQKPWPPTEPTKTERKYITSFSGITCTVAEIPKDATDIEVSSDEDGEGIIRFYKTLEVDKDKYETRMRLYNEARRMYELDLKVYEATKADMERNRRMFLNQE